MKILYSPKLNHRLLDEYRQETKQEPLYSKDGMTMHTIRYINWLEDIITKLQKGLI